MRQFIFAAEYFFSYFTEYFFGKGYLSFAAK